MNFISPVYGQCLAQHGILMFSRIFPVSGQCLAQHGILMFSGHMHFEGLAGGREDVAFLALNPG